MFWVYGRLGAGFSLLAGFAAAVAHLRLMERPAPGAVVAATVLAGLTVLLSRPGALGCALFSVWLWHRRLRPCQPLGGGRRVGRRRPTRSLAPRVRRRRRPRRRRRGPSGMLGAAVFAERQWWFATELFTSWWLLLAVPALVTGLVDRRTRAPVAITGSLAVIWMLVPNDASFIHDFWNLLWLLPVAVGTAALADLVATRLARRSGPALAAVTGIALVAALTGVITAATRSATSRLRPASGALLQGAPLPPGLELVAVGAETPCHAGLRGGGRPRCSSRLRATSGGFNRRRRC